MSASWIALDLAQSSGIAWYEGTDLRYVTDIVKKAATKKRGTVWEKTTHPIKADDKTPIVGTYHSIHEALAAEFRVDLIHGFCMEDGFIGRNMKSSMQTAELRGVAKGLLYAQCALFTPRYYPKPSDWRKVVEQKLTLEGLPFQLAGTDREHAKRLALSLVKELHGLDNITDNAAEAVLLGKAYILSGRYAVDHKEMEDAR